MAGLDDGVVDALFGISQPLSGAYLWCPPIKAGRLDMSALKL
jgi:putative iron-dependent peroxidase